MTASNDRQNGPRPWGQMLFFSLLLGIALGMSLLNQGMIDLTHPIEIWVDSDMPEAKVVAAAVSAQGVVEAAYERKCWESGPIGSFKTKWFPYKGILLIGSPATLEQVTRVTFRMATQRTVFERDQFQKAWTRYSGPLPEDTPAGWEGRLYQLPAGQGESFNAVLNQAVNYEGDAALAKYVLLSAVFIVYLIWFVALLLLRALVAWRRIDTAKVPAVVFGDSSTLKPVGNHAWPWLFAGVGVLMAAGVMLERQYPYYFTQDDNFAQFLPNMLYGCESLSAGAFPEWNPHQYLGAPLAEIGTYALTYPGTYISYAIAVWILGDRNATIEVFCWLHLLLGYFALFWLGRRLSLTAPLASAFSLCQVLSGFALVIGRSWYYMTPVYLWVPLLFVALLHIRTQAPTLRWTIATGLVIGLFFHAGNAQMWIYAMALAGLFVLWNCLNQSMPLVRLIQMIPAGLVGLGVAAVLLVPQFSATRDLRRIGGLGTDIGEGVLALFAPYPTPIIVDPENQRRDADPEHFGVTYYAGSVFTVAWLAVLVGVGLCSGTMRSFLRDPWNGLALFTFLLALGDVAMLWTWQSHLPVLNQFNHPLKFLPFFHLFSCAVGAVFVNRAIRLSSWPGGWQVATFSAIAGLLLYHAYWSQAALYLYVDRPYPALPGELSDLRSRDSQQVRILPLTFNRSASANFVGGLQNNFPTVYGISSIGGYDPLIEQESHYDQVLKELSKDPRSALRRYGVTHLILHREVVEAMKKRDWASDEWRWLLPAFGTLVADCERAKPVMKTESVRVFEVKHTMPIACTSARPSEALPVRLVPSGADVDVSSLKADHEVVLNFLWRPGTRVYADGILVPTSADGDQHIRVPVRAGTKNLELRYQSPWLAGFLLGGALVALGLLGWRMAGRFEPRRHREAISN